MKILSAWLRAYLPDLNVSDCQLADDLTLRGIAIEGVFDLGGGNGSLFEMDITTNRVDAMNHYGVAREAMAIYGIPLQPLETTLPPATRATQAFPVRIEAPDLCGRFTARVLRNVRIAPSQGEVAARFALLEQKLISNAVDATNFVTLAMGHPTHAFDLDKLEGGIVVRRARAGEKLRLLDGTERILVADDLVVADEKKALALAGIMGGWDTMITPETKNILVEAAWFDPGIVRRSSRRHGLHTDASHRFERGADFSAPPVASAMVSRLILEAGGEIEGEFIDVVVPEVEQRTAGRSPIVLEFSEVDRMLGSTVKDHPLDAPTVERYIKALGANVKATGAGTYSVQLPSWRLDLEREIDLIEEIARLHGYNRFQNTLPAFTGTVVELSWAAKERAVRGTLLAGGYTEAVSSTFCAEADAKIFAASADQYVHLGNPLSEEVGCLRPSLVPGMLTMLQHNLNREVDTIRLFEMGTIFSGPASGAVERVLEKPSLAIGATGAAFAAHAVAAAREYSFYDVKGIAEELLSKFGTVNSVFFDTKHLPAWLHAGRSVRALVNNETVGYFGQLDPQQAESRKLRQVVFVGEFDLKKIYQLPLRSPVTRELSRFPAVVRDFSFLFPAQVRWQQIAAAVQALAIPEMRSLQPLEIFRDKKTMAAAEMPGGYAMLLRAEFQAQDRTLRLEELQGWARRIFAALMETGGKPRFPEELL